MYQERKELGTLDPITVAESMLPERPSFPAYSIQVGKLDSDEWNRALSRFDDASIYQTFAYGSVHWDKRQLEHVLLKKEGEILAVAQLRVVQFAGIRAGIAYLRWGPLVRVKNRPFAEENLGRMLIALKDEYARRRKLVLRVLPHSFETDASAGAVRERLAAAGLAENPAVPKYETIRLDLTRPLEVLRGRFEQKWRNCLNAAEKKKLTVIQGTSTELYDKFLQVYWEMMERKHFDTSVDVDEFRRMQVELPEPFKMQLFLCEQEGKVTNALVVSAIGDTAIYLLGATSSEGLKLKGAYLLQWRAIQWLKAQGCRWYDLGGINQERNPGVYHFKSGLGGNENRQLGMYDLSGGWASTIGTRAGEQIQSTRSALRSYMKRTLLWLGSIRQKGAGSS